MMIFKNKFIKAGRVLCRHKALLPYIYIGMVIFHLLFTSPFVFSSDNLFAELLSGLVLFLGIRVRWAAENKESKKLRSILTAGGIYSVMRFPFYLSDLLIMLGIAIYIGSFSFLLVFLLISIIVIERMLMYEEGISYNRLGEDYVKWYNSTNAIVPVIWNWRGATYSRSLAAKAQCMIRPLLFIFFSLNLIYIVKYYRANFELSINYFLFVMFIVLFVLSILIYIRRRKA